MLDAPNFLASLGTLVRNQAEVIVVGGVAAVVWGAPITTSDVDVLYRRSPENVGRLVTALRELEAIYRDPAGRRIVPETDRLLPGGHHLLVTRYGALDVLATVGHGLTYEDVLDRSEELDLGDFRIRVLGLEGVIETKEQAGRTKDKLVLQILRDTLRLRRETEG